MEWMSPVSTLLGAAIGVGATLVADRVRWRRERVGQSLDVRRQLYGEYTAALSRMRTALNECARSDVAAEERARRVREVFLAPGAYEIRHQLAVIAPQETIAASRAAFLVLRDTRDALLDGAAVESTLYRELEDRFDSAVAELRRVMRRDLGVAE